MNIYSGELDTRVHSAEVRAPYPVVVVDPRITYLMGFHSIEEATAHLSASDKIETYQIHVFSDGKWRPAETHSVQSQAPPPPEATPEIEVAPETVTPEPVSPEHPAVQEPPTEPTFVFPEEPDVAEPSDKNTPQPPEAEPAPAKKRDESPSEANPFKAASKSPRKPRKRKPRKKKS